MINLKYSTPKEKNKGRRENETVESSSTHSFKDVTRELVSEELSKLMARYPDYDFEVDIKFKKSK